MLKFHVARLPFLECAASGVGVGFRGCRQRPFVTLKLMAGKGMKIGALLRFNHGLASCAVFSTFKSTRDHTVSCFSLAEMEL